MKEFMKLAVHGSAVVMSAVSLLVAVASLGAALHAGRVADRATEVADMAYEAVRGSVELSGRDRQEVWRVLDEIRAGRRSGRDDLGDFVRAVNTVERWVSDGKGEAK